MRVLALMLATFVAPAAAADFTQLVPSENGQPYVECVKNEPGDPGRCVETQSLTLGHMIANALNAPAQGLKPEEIVARGLLVLKVRDAKDLELDDKERDLVKAAMFAAVEKLGYKPVAVVQVLKVIDPAAVKGSKP